MDAGLSFASNTSQEDSVRQAQTVAQDITERALERVVSKVKEERVVTMIEEFEENNKHGFDNRRGDNHVVGVYRWIDKLYKNQIYRYDKRMIFEFMIPDPAKLHTLGMEVVGTDLTEPLDPRSVAGTMKMATYSSVTELSAAYWAGYYNVEITPALEDEIYISDAFADNGLGGNYMTTNYHVGGKNFSMEIPEGYNAVSVAGKFAFGFVPKDFEWTRGVVTIGDYEVAILDVATQTKIINTTFPGAGIQKKIGIGFFGMDVGGISISLRVKCKRNAEYFRQWKQETFKSIMDAYEEALAEHKRRKAEQDSLATETKRTNPGFYRQIENIILKKNCISYLINRNNSATYTYGKDLGNSGILFGSYEVNLNSTLDKYASFVKFIEQAFEWNIMSYNFYPFYWGPKNSWTSKYQTEESNDPIFRAFLQSGMARVIVTVRPGFEEAVQLYLTTGILWNGGQVPLMGDSMYVDLMHELALPNGDKIGKPWISRVPTALTILQGRSIGLEVTQALPCNCDDTSDFENPEDVPCSDKFTLEDFKIGGNDGPEEPVEPAAPVEPIQP
ncbi:MAG TPA: hypothetical protein VF602_07580 [Pedobacter sp.]